MQQTQDRPQRGEREAENAGRAQDGKLQRRGVGLSEAFRVVCAEILREADRKALREALDQTQDKPVQPFPVADGGQRVKPKHLSDDHRIYHRIELLKNISDHQRQREGKQNPKRRAGGHTFH